MIAHDNNLIVKTSCLLLLVLEFRALASLFSSLVVGSGASPSTCSL